MGIIRNMTHMSRELNSVGIFAKFGVRTPDTKKNETYN